MNIAELANLF